MLEGSTEYQFPQTLQASADGPKCHYRNQSSADHSSWLSEAVCLCVGFSGDGLRVRKIKIVFFGLSSNL